MKGREQAKGNIVQMAGKRERGNKECKGQLQYKGGQWGRRTVKWKQMVVQRKANGGKAG